MKKLSLTLFAFLMTALSVIAQVPYGRTDRVTLLKDFVPAKILMNSGQVLNVKQANVFLKNSSLVYKDRMGKDMEANMSLVKSVSIAGKEFITFDGKLAEIIAVCGDNRLYRVQYIDEDALKGEILNMSNITSMNLETEHIGITRDDVPSDELRFPIVAQYYYVIDGKEMKCHEREVSRKISKQKRETYNVVTHRGVFNWANEDDLKALLQELTN